MARARAARAAREARSSPSLAPSPGDGGAAEGEFPSSASPPEEWTSPAAVAELQRLLSVLPAHLRSRVEEHPRQNELLELVLDLGRTPFARFSSGEAPLSDQALTRTELDDVLKLCGTFGADNRAGIDRTLHRISAMRNRRGQVVGLTCRVGRSIAGSAELVRDLVTEGHSLLLMGPPGVGKTTALREVARILADDVRRRVVIVDSSNEIGGDGDVAHPGIGGARRMQMTTPDTQHAVMIEAVENHMPQTIVVDEIGTDLEAAAARTIAQRGVQLIATAHGRTLQNVVQNPCLVSLVGGVDVVTLGDEEARRRGGAKTVLERQGPPTFSVAVEMLAIGHWRVHLDVGAAVDAMLANQEPATQIRRCGSNGAVIVEQCAGAPAEAFTQQQGPLRGSAAPVRSSRGAAQPGLSSAAAPMLADPVPPGAVRLYCHGVDADAMGRVIGTLRMHSTVVLTPLLEEADAVLALRSRIGRSGADDWLRITARQRGVPLYAIKEDSLSNLVRALQTIVGPAPRWSAAATNPGAAGGDSAAAAAAATPADEQDALEEARLAVERIVIPTNRAVDLLPRAAAVRQAQEALAQSYQLVTVTAGTGSAAHVRILPEYSP
jgi:stage III sporulation protein SpoIIIAA